MLNKIEQEEFFNSIKNRKIRLWGYQPNHYFVPKSYSGKHIYGDLHTPARIYRNYSEYMYHGFKPYNKKVRWSFFTIKSHLPEWF